MRCVLVLRTVVLFMLSGIWCPPIQRWLEKGVVTEVLKILVTEEIYENSAVLVDAAIDGTPLTYRVEKNGGNIVTGEKLDTLIQIPNEGYRMWPAR